MQFSFIFDSSRGKKDRQAQQHIYAFPFFCFIRQIDAIEGGHSALHSACHEGHCDIIRELLDRGANRTALVIN